MGLLDNLLQGGQQQEYQNFANQYQQGMPPEAYNGQEVLNRYQQVAPNLNQQQYMNAAMAAFQNMTPQQRQEFGQYLAQQGQQQGINFPNAGGNYENPDTLAQMATHAHQQQPGLLGKLFSPQGGKAPIDNPAVKVALAGIAAMAIKHAIDQRNAH